MTSLTINKEVRNGIEYWVSSDASQVGMSLSGLQVMAPVNISTLSRLVEDYSNLHKLPTEGLETLRSNGLSILDVAQERGGKPVKFIPAELCYEIISYYALDAKKVSEEVRQVAIDNMKACGAVGMKMFILNQVGYKVSLPTPQPDISGMLSTIVAKMEEMTELTKRYVAIKEATKKQPGLDHILENYEKGYLLSDGVPFPLSKWVKAKGLILTHGQKISLGMAVQATFKTHKSINSPLGANVRLYTAEDIPLLEAALKNI